MAKWVVLLWVWFPAFAFANDAEFSNTSGGPAPIQNDHIRMVSEDITIARQKSGDWKIDAVYVFENTSKTTQKITVGFPEFFGDSEKEFLKLKTSVRGERVSMTTKKSVKGSTRVFGKSLGRVHLFDVAFKPKETLTIDHTFKMGPSSSVAIADETFVSYVTKTGAFWKGPIGRATFTLKTRDIYELIAIPTTYRVKSVKRFVIQKGVRAGMEVVLEMKDWTPTQDLHIALFRDSDRTLQHKMIGECPRLEIQSWQKFEKASRKEKATLSTLGDLSKYSTKQLRLCRNWIYAKYGYAFKDKKLRKLFYKKPSIGKYPPIDLDDYPTTMEKLIRMDVDPGYTTGMLNVEDLLTIEKMKAEEAARKRKK